MIVVCPYCRAEVTTDVHTLWIQCTSCSERVDLSALGTAPRGLAGPSAPERGLSGRVIGGYQLGELIGIGGMGVVYRARSVAEPDGEDVAVKILALAAAANPVIVARFERETRLLSELDHKNIVPLRDSGVEGDWFYIVMPFVGDSVAAALARKELTTSQVTRIVSDIAAALDYAHKRQIIHRDLKPTNVLLDGDTALLSDFGVAYAPYDKDVTSLTNTAAIVGTFNYMSPEQRTGAKGLDQRADIYALGVLTYELLTGRVPIGVFASASASRPELHADVDTAIARALDQEPASRFDTAPEFAAALGAAIARSDGDVVVPSATPRRGLWAIAALVAAGVTAAALAATGAFSSGDATPTLDRDEVIASANIERGTSPPAEREPAKARAEAATKPAAPVPPGPETAASKTGVSKVKKTGTPAVTKTGAPTVTKTGAAAATKTGAPAATKTDAPTVTKTGAAAVTKTDTPTNAATASKIGSDPSKTVAPPTVAPREIVAIAAGEPSELASTGRTLSKFGVAAGTAATPVPEGAAATAPGFVYLVASPTGHELIVDDVATGRRTPIRQASPLELSPGTHTLRLRSESGKLGRARRLTVASGEVKKFSLAGATTTSRVSLKGGKGWKTEDDALAAKRRKSLEARKKRKQPPKKVPPSSKKTPPEGIE